MTADRVYSLTISLLLHFKTLQSLSLSYTLLSFFFCSHFLKRSEQSSYIHFTYILHTYIHHTTLVLFFVPSTSMFLSFAMYFSCFFFYTNFRKRFTGTSSIVTDQILFLPCFLYYLKSLLCSSVHTPSLLKRFTACFFLHIHHLQGTRAQYATRAECKHHHLAIIIFHPVYNARL